MDNWYTLPGFFDPMSSMSHLVGAIVYLVLSFFLLISAWPCRKRFWLTFVFANSAIALLAISGVYHMFRVGGTPREVLLRLDVAAIFLLIAATFTPIHGVLFQGWRRWSVLVPLWTIAGTGIVLRSAVFTELPQWIGTSIFLAMGWIGGFSSILLWNRYRWSVVPLCLGGVFYSVGGIIHVLKWPTIVPLVWGPHETFHLLVLAALGCHWSFIGKIADGTLICQDKRYSLETKRPSAIKS